MAINYKNRSKIDDIKAVRTATKCGLKEAKDAVELDEVNSVEDAIKYVLKQQGIEIQKDVFWMLHVINNRAPTVRHATLAAAENEAERLCKEMGVTEVYVLKTEKVFRASVMITKENIPNA